MDEQRIEGERMLFEEINHGLSACEVQSDRFIIVA